MTRPTTLTFEEAAFTMPWHENRQVIHDQAYEVLLEGKHIPDDEKTRPFVFDVTLLDPSTRLALVTARGHRLANGIQSEAASLTVKEGDALTIRTRVSAMKRQTIRTPEKTQQRSTYVQAQDVAPWATDLLARYGMAASNIKLLDYQLRRVYKRSQRFGINEAFIEARVTVESAADFTRGFLCGIGRQKGYGYGLIEVVS